MSNSELNFLGTPLVDTGPGISNIDIGVTWAFTSIAVAFVAARFYLHARFSGSISVDDWLTLAALVLLIASSACTTKANLHGMGRSFESMTLEDYKVSNYWSFVFGPINVFVGLFARTAIAILLNRIFGMSKPWFRRYLIGWTIFLVIGGILSLVLYLARLTPIQAQWDPTVKYHVNFAAIIEEYIALGAEYQMIISDITYVFFPVYFIWKLQMQWHRKVGLLVLMSAGLATFAAGLARIIIATKVVESTFYATQDAGVLIGLMAIVENSLAISMGCVPTLGHIKMLQFGFISRLGESLASLLGRSRRGSKSSLAKGYNFPYQDAEHGSGAKFYNPDDGAVPLAALHPKGSSQGFVVAAQEHPSNGHANNIRRTEEYIVSYEHRNDEETGSQVRMVQRY